MRLSPPDPHTAAALKRLKGDPDFQRVMDWWRKSLGEMDNGIRTMTDSVMLRMGQGAASCLASIIEHAEAKARPQGALRDVSVVATAKSATGERSS